MMAVLRRLYDTRVFRGIYTDRAGWVVPEQRRRHVDVSRVAARSALSREMVDFLERDVPYVLYSLYSVLGAMAMLWFYDPLLAPTCLLLLPPVWLLSRAYGRKTFRLQGKLNDQLEREVDIIERGCAHETRKHYGLVGKSHVKLSDPEAFNFVRMQLLIFALTAGALVRCCSAAGPAQRTAGPGLHPLRPR